MTSRRTVMNAFGKYLTYANHLALIKRGEAKGDRAEFARACVMLAKDYQEKMYKFIDGDDDE